MDMRCSEIVKFSGNLTVPDFRLVSIVILWFLDDRTWRLSRDVEYLYDCVRLSSALVSCDLFCELAIMPGSMKTKNRKGAKKRQYGYM